MEEAGKHNEVRLPADTVATVGRAGKEAVMAEVAVVGEESGPELAEDGLEKAEVPNLERGLVLMKQPEGSKEEDEEEEYVFEEEKDAMLASNKWMAIARFYSGHEYKTWVLFNELNKSWGKTLPVPVRDLRDNRFLVEFDTKGL